MTLSETFKLELHTRLRGKRDAETNQKWDRCSVVLNSMWHIPEEIMSRPRPYDAVVVDEAEFVRLHLANTTMSVVAHKVSSVMYARCSIYIWCHVHCTGYMVHDTW